ncbi:MAG TPA: putative molybdenum carrier protein [Alphaproteobacteria bacterium]|nr:putative molybdenum carrier protein [Alphaproteobacteria bacterium]
MAERETPESASAFSIVSGGQTGVDRAALDAAMAVGLPCGGWCPAGRAAEDGPIDGHYPLGETPQSDPAVRTRLNVSETDATLILTLGEMDAGTRLAKAEAETLGRLVLVLDLSETEDALATRRILDWLREASVRRLNVAGPRESNAPGVYARARTLLETLFSAVPR